MTTPPKQPLPRLLTRANESRCKLCPPERICAWACVQGAGFEDILIGAVLEQSQSWALERTAPDATDQALWETYNT